MRLLLVAAFHLNPCSELMAIRSPSPVVSTACDHFNKVFGVAPVLWASAPGRVNVIGEHVDYNGGWVLPAAIDRRMALVLRPRADDQVILTDAREPGTVAFGLGRVSPAANGDWSNYVRGVVAGLQQAGVIVPGFEACLYSEVPMGGGLSSSAALEAVTAVALQELLGFEMDRMAMAKLCQQAEHDFAGVPCGLMDQAAVLNAREGHLLLLDCATEAVQHAPFADPGWNLMVINSGVSHSLADGEYAKRRASCEAAAEVLGVDSLRALSAADLPGIEREGRLEDEPLACVRHVLTENGRTLDAVEALREGDFARLGERMKESHASLRDDYRVSCPELDFIVEAASGLDGVAGCRMTGGGFGGSCIALVETRAVEAAEGAIGSAYEQKFGQAPGIFVTRPAAGAEAGSLA